MRMHGVGLGLPSSLVGPPAAATYCETHSMVACIWGPRARLSRGRSMQVSLRCSRWANGADRIDVRWISLAMSLPFRRTRARGRQSGRRSR